MSDPDRAAESQTPRAPTGTARATPIDWTKPPHKVGGVVDFHLDGDPPHLPAPELERRMTEYLEQSRPGFSLTTPGAWADSLRLAPRVFAEVAAEPEKPAA